MGELGDSFLTPDCVINRKPFVIDAFGKDVQKVHADFVSHTIDGNGRLFQHGVHTVRRFDKPLKVQQCMGDGLYAEFVIDENKKLWSWGRNRYGELGHREVHIDEPKMIESFKDVQIRQIDGDGSCSYTACVTMDNQLFVFGKCQMFGLDGNASLPIHLPHAVPIVNVACGKRHTLIMCTDGTVFSIGANDCAQLGHGEPPWKGNKKTFTKIDQLKDITAIECGDRASAALSVSGTGKESKKKLEKCFYVSKFLLKVYIWGTGLLSGDYNVFLVPTRVNGINDKVIDISLGGEHMLALTENNQLFAWGCNKWGQCGVSSADMFIMRPTPVRGFEPYELLQISAGWSHSLIKCKELE